MSELHTYRIAWIEPRTEATRAATIRTSAGTLAQFVVGINYSGQGVQIEQIPDAPERGPDIGELVHALEWCGGSPDFNEGGRACEGWARVVQPLLDRFHGKPDAPLPRREWATIPVAGVNLTPLEGTGRAFTPSDRAEALDEELRLRTRERDHAREAAEDHFEEVRALVDAITGSPDPGNHTTPDAAARLAGETRARLKNLDAAAEKWTDALHEIAAIVWPNKAGRSTDYALTDIVEAVRKMGAERESLSRNLNTGIREQAEMNRKISGLAEDLRAGVKKIEVLQAERDRANRHAATASHMVAEGWKVLGGPVGNEGWLDALERVVRERDALQKRIDSARKWLTTDSDGAPRPDLLAILEGREP